MSSQSRQTPKDADVQLAVRRLVVGILDDVGSLTDGITSVLTGAFQSAPCRAAIGVILVNGAAAITQRLSGESLPEAFRIAVAVYDVLTIGVGCLMLLRQVRQAGNSKSS